MSKQLEYSIFSESVYEIEINRLCGLSEIIINKRNQSSYTIIHDNKYELIITINPYKEFGNDIKITKKRKFSEIDIYNKYELIISENTLELNGINYNYINDDKVFIYLKK